MAKMKWLAVWAVGESREECQRLLDESFASGKPNKYAAVIVAAVVPEPLLNDDYDGLIVVRRNALVSSVLAAMEPQ